MRVPEHFYLGVSLQALYVITVVVAPASFSRSGNARGHCDAVQIYLEAGGNMNEFESLGQIPQHKHESRFEPKKAKRGKPSPRMCRKESAVARTSVLSPQRRRVILSVHLLSMDSGTRPRAELPIVMPQLSSLLESQRKTKRPRQMRNLNPKGAPPNFRVHRPDHSRHGSGLGQLLV